MRKWTSTLGLLEVVFGIPLEQLPGFSNQSRELGGRVPLQEFALFEPHWVAGRDGAEVHVEMSDGPRSRSLTRTVRQNIFARKPSETAQAFDRPLTGRVYRAAC